MSEEKYYDYLVLGGEHNGYIYNGLLTRNLEVRSDRVPMAKMYAHDAPAETITPETVSYKVYEHIRDDGKHFFIATNESLDTFDVDEMIAKSGIRPVN
ncbi:TPA: hypothetical protein N2N50_003580 [Kluyvera ascorbata]|nr:hypothetical protein [Escherichia coli]HCL5622541.1 hypothetical protein [Kluyvera ascorbata]HED3199947.1 hypothetical protein [Kluyvera ascorbata]HED4087261.1 hypothetical protein [Kluyvera ascorbata]